MARDCWKPARLGDLVSIKHGWPFKSELFSDDLTGRPIVVAVGNFQYTGGFRFDTTGVKEYCGEYPRDYELAADDILLVMTCQTSGGEILGIPARVPGDGRVYLHNQRLGKVVLKRPDLADPKFLYWTFLSKPFNFELCASATGTKIVHTAPTRIEAYQFDLPPLPEQRAIAAVLGALDDKIEVNRKMARVLEEIARAVFTSWFVDFDPVHYNIQRRDEEQAYQRMGRAARFGSFGEDISVIDKDGRSRSLRPEDIHRHIAHLFPDHLVDSPLGEVPEGWRVGTLGDVVNQRVERVDPSATTAAMPYLPIECISAKCLLLSDKRPGKEAQSSLTRFYVDDILVGAMRPYFHKVCIAPFDGTTRTTAFVLKPHTQSDWAYAVLLLHREETIEFATRHSTGSTIPYARWDSLRSMPIVIPSENLRAAFQERCSMILRRIAGMHATNATLAALRDTLLPKLISGELRIADAERIVGRAV